MNSEGILHHPAYLSTSLNKSTAKRFSPHDNKNEKNVLKIHVPEGSSGSYVGHISFNPKEKEFILPAGTNLKYHHTKIEVDRGYLNPLFNVHHMNLIKR